METKEVVLLGPPGAGKTSLVQALTGLSKPIQPTVGQELYAMRRDNLLVHLWDTPGQDNYASISSQLIDRADLVLLCSCDGIYADPKGKPSLKVRTKDDLNLPWFPADVATSSLTGFYIQQLCNAVFTLLENQSPPEVDGGCCCSSGISAVATHSKVDQYRLDLLFRQ